MTGYRIVRWFILVLAAWAALAALPSVERYLRMRAISDPRTETDRDRTT